MLSRVRHRTVRFLLPRLLKPRTRSDLVRLGSDYGGWWVPAELISSTSVVYAAGVGEDITWDVAMLDRFACRVVGIDPTPRAVAHVNEVAPPNYEFVPVGIGGSDRVARFYVPRNNEHVSHSMTNLQRTEDYFEAEVRSLPTLMASLGDDHVDMLKLDIEGAHHEVLEALGPPLPKVLSFEVDQPEPLRRTLAAHRRVCALGYQLVMVDGMNLTYVLR